MLFHECGFNRTKVTLCLVDEGSLNPGKQIFEKMISGMYMGELVRQVQYLQGFRLFNNVLLKGKCKKNFFSMAWKPISIHWIRTGSQPD